MNDAIVARLKEDIPSLMKHADLLLGTASLLDDLNRTGDTTRIERVITERLADVIRPLARLTDAREELLLQAIGEVELPAAEQERLNEVRKRYSAYKTTLMMGQAFDQGYINRITGVRYRPHLFLLSNTPALDFTLRSFDRNAFRGSDTLDNVMSMVAGIVEGVAASCEKLRAISVEMPSAMSKKLIQEVDRTRAGLAKIEGLRAKASSEPPEETSGTKKPVRKHSKREQH